MKIILLSVLTLWFQVAAAEFHVWGYADQGTPAYNVGASEADVVNVLKERGLTQPPPENKMWVKIGSCKSPGWFVVMWSTYKEGENYRREIAGACGLPTERAALAAATKSCQSKPNCARNLRGDTMSVSIGFDSGAVTKPPVDGQGNPVYRSMYWAGEKSRMCQFDRDGQYCESYEAGVKKRVSARRDELF